MSLQVLWGFLAAHPAKLINLLALLITCPGGLLLQSARRREVVARASGASDEAVVDAFKKPADMTGKTFPQLVKNHTADGWLAIIGGQVYRGPCYPDLNGKYFFTDNNAHTLSVATFDGTNVTATDLPGTWPTSPASIHADARGELYETTTNGSVYHIEAGP